MEGQYHVGAVKSVLKKWFKINDTISAFVGSVIFSESTRGTVQQ